MFRIGELAEDEASEAAAVTEECFRDAWENWMKGYYPKEAVEADLADHTAEAYRRRIRSPDSLVLSVREGKRIVGVATAEIRDGGVAHLRWMCVDPDARRRGIGNQMLESVEDLAKTRGCHKVSVVILPCLTDAVRLCYRRGWVPECNLTRHSWKVDFMVMSKWFD